MSCTSAGGLDAVIPPVRPDEVSQGAAKSVGPVLTRVGHERDALIHQVRLGERRRLRTQQPTVKPDFFVSGVSIPKSRMRSRPRLSSRMSMVSPSTTFSTSAVVATESAETRSGAAYTTTANTAMVTTATRMPSQTASRVAGVPVVVAISAIRPACAGGPASRKLRLRWSFDGTPHDEQIGRRLGRRHPWCWSHLRTGDSSCRPDPPNTLTRRTGQIETLSCADRY
jgi:hypothetical protein